LGRIARLPSGATHACHGVPAWDGTPIPTKSYGAGGDAALAAGLDMTLIEYSLTFTHEERAQRLQDTLDTIFELREAKAAYDAATKR